MTITQQSSKLRDSFQRTINYMRISVTDRCNMRCRYCMPDEGVPWLPKENILTYEEILRVVEAGARLGLRRLRLTGGEPLVRHDLSSLVAKLAAVPGIEDLALSTNAVLLSDYAVPLAAAGLKRVNVSLDSLDPQHFVNLTRRDYLRRALDGIAAADAAGLHPIKINCVAVRGWNDMDLAAMAALSIDRPYHIRFIEVMPLHGNAEWQPEWFMPAGEILERVSALGKLDQCSGPAGNGPARYWQFAGARGTVGVISPLSHSYCESCNRVRVSADGRLRLCLFGDHDVDLRTLLRSGATIEQLREAFQGAILAKPERHNLDTGKACGSIHALSEIGG